MMHYLNNKLLLIIFFIGGVASAQSPDSVGFESSDPYIFSSALFSQPTGQLLLTVYDENGAPVPENTPIAFWLSTGQIQHPSLFHSISNPLGYGGTMFFLTTSAGGIVETDYIPGRYIQPHSNFQIYARAYQVTFADPSDSTSAGWTGFDLIDDYAVDFPFLVGISDYTVLTQDRYGERFVFANDEMFQEQTAEVTITVTDDLGRGVPAGVPVALRFYRVDWWGNFISDQIFNQYTDSYNEYTNYFFQTDEQGQLQATYRTPADLYSSISWPYDRWYAWYGSAYNSEEEAFAAWEMERRIPVSVEAVWVSPNDSVGAMGSLTLTDGSFPVIVGPNRVSVQTVGDIHGDQYLFTNKTKVEGAEITYQLLDDAGRPVPSGVPLMLANVGYSPVDGLEMGRITPLNQYPVIYAGSDSYSSARAVVFTGENGIAKIHADPPYLSPGMEIPQSDVNINHYGLFCRPAIAYFYDSNESWSANYTLLTDAGNSTLPVLTSPATATVNFQPPVVPALKIASTGKIKLNDTRGRPVPQGATIRLSVNEGTIFGNEFYEMETLVMRDGKMTVPYLSPTRSINDDITATLSVEKTIIDDFVNPTWYYLGNGSVQLVGPAVNPSNPSLGQLIFGKSFTDILSDLNPLKALGSMRDMAQQADSARAARIRLHRLAGDPNTTDEELQNAMQNFRNRFNTLASDGIANFIQDVPGTSFDPSTATGGHALYQSLAQNGIRRHLTDMVKDKLKDESKGVVRDFIEHKTGFRFPQVPFLQNRPGQSFHFNRSTATSNQDPYHVELLSPLYTKRGTTQLMEAYGLEFRISNITNNQVMDSIAVGDRFPVPNSFLPEEAGIQIAPNGALVSPGFIEITQVNPAENGFDFVVVGVMFPNPNELLHMVTAETAYDNSVTSIPAMDGSVVEIPVGSVVDSVTFFLLQTPPPTPVNPADSLIIKTAYAFGSIDQDSVIQHVDLITPATMLIDTTYTILDSTLLPLRLAPYKYDELTQSWQLLPTLDGHGTDTLAFEIQETAIYGIGGSTTALPPQPVLTTIEITPDSAVVFFGDSLQLVTQGFDQFGNFVLFNPAWTATRGEISQEGLFVADSTTGIAIITVEDAYTGVVSSVDIQIHSHPPVLNPIPELSWDEDDSLTIFLDTLVIDTDDTPETLNWTVTHINSNSVYARKTAPIHPKFILPTIREDGLNISIDANSRLVVLSGSQDFFGGPFMVEFAVSDTAGMTDRDTVQTTILAVNDTPQVSLPDSIQWFEDDSTTLALDDHVIDPDDEPATLAWDTQVLSGSNAPLRKKKINTGTNQSAVHTYVFLWENQRIHPPGESVRHLKSVVNDRTESATVTFPDSIIITIDDSTHIATFTATMDYFIAAVPVVFYATDTSGAMGQDTLHVTINPVNDQPLFTTQPPDTLFEEDNMLKIPLSYYANMVTDADDSPDNFTWEFTTHDSVEVEIVEDSVSYTAPPNWFGTDSVIIQVSDGTYQAQSLFRVAVLAVNDTPQVSLPDSLQWYEDDSTTLALDDHVIDPDDEPATLAWEVQVLSGSNAPLREKKINTGTNQSSVHTYVFLWENQRIHPPGESVRPLKSTLDDRPESATFTFPDSIIITIDDSTHVATFTATMDYFIAAVPVVFYATDTSGAMGQDTLHVTINPVNDPPVFATQPPDTLFEEDDLLKIPLSYYANFVADADDSPDNFIWEFTTHDSVEVDIVEDSVSYTAPPNWFGTDSVIIQVSDGTYQAQSLFQVTVLPVNDLPDPFNLLHPDDGHYASDSVNIVFGWEATTDIENDHVAYLLRLWDDIGISDTTVLLEDTSFVVNVLDFEFPVETLVFWQVGATDGIDTTQATNGPWSFIISNTLGVQNLGQMPDHFGLYQNYPNPFNPVTTIKYSLPEPSAVNITIYNLTGERIKSLAKTRQSAGWYTVVWNGTNDHGIPVSSGVYFYRMVTPGFIDVKKLLLLK